LAAALLAPPVLLVLVELGLRLGGFGYPTTFFLPMKIRGQECLVENERFGWRFFGPEMARTPFPVVLPKAKAPGTTRIFVFGESAAYGDPQPDFGLPRMLEALLTLRFPDRHFEVVNTGMTGINSHVIAPIAEDCVRQEGDVWIIYAGNNEVVGPFGSGTVFGPKAPPRNLVRLSLAFKATRLGQLFDSIGRALHKKDAAQAVWGGMPMFVKNHVREDDPRMARVYANFAGNLDRIITLGASHGAKVVVSSMARNLRDCAPFASEHRLRLAPEDLARWEQAYEKGVEAQRLGKASEAVASFQQAAQIDGAYADLHFRWGQCALALSNQTDARREFTLACDEDALRFRSDTRLNDIIKHTAEAHQKDGVVFVDGQEMLASASPDHLVGEKFLYEHVHLNFSGNYLLARALAAQVAPTNSVWPTEAECARRLSFTELNRGEGEKEILQRLHDPPYTGQLDYAEEYERHKERYEALAGAAKPAALAAEKKICQDAVKAWPEDWILRQNLAMFDERTGDNAGAAAEWQHVTELLPQSHEAWKSLGIALARMKKSDEAAAAFHHALGLHPNDVPALDGLAELALDLGQNEEARRYFERILRLQPYFGPAHLGLGRILDAAGQHEQAQVEFQKSMEARVNTPKAFAGLARFFFQRGDYQKAAVNFTDSLRLDPTDPEIHINLGLTLTQLGRLDEAFAHYAEAVRLDPNLAEAHFCLGMAKGRRRDDAGAMEQFAEAVRLKPELLEAHLNLGISLLNQHRDAEARAQFEEALRRAPDNATARAYLQRLAQRAP
jgi:tetratricopeptide (TPR) repeat protein